MGSRVDMLAGMALQGLLAHPHHAAHPMSANAQALAARAVALARAIDSELGPEENAIGVVGTSFSVSEDDVRRIIGEVFAEDAARPSTSAKGKQR